MVLSALYESRVSARRGEFHLENTAFDVEARVVFVDLIAFTMMLYQSRAVCDARARYSDGP